jgi:hypothetical protein
VVRRRVRLHGAVPLAGFDLLLVHLPHQLLHPLAGAVTPGRRWRRQRIERGES